MPAIPFPADVTICGPIPPAPNYDTIDACGVNYPVLVSSSIQNGPCNDGDGCIVTRVWIRRGCGTIAESQTQTITVDCDITYGGNLSTGIQSRRPAEFTVFPNPGKNMVSVSLTEEMSNGGVFEVLDLSGRLIHKEFVQNLAGNDSLEFNLESLNTGIYVLRLSSGSYQATKKWIKQ